MSERMDVSPLSPARQCASSCSFGIARPLLDRHLRRNALPVDQRRDDADLLMDILAGAAPARGTVGVERLDFFADDHRPFCGRSPRRDTQADLVGMSGDVEGLAVHRSAPDKLDAKLRKLASQASADDIPCELRASDGVGSRIPDLAFAAVAREIPDADLELLRSSVALRAPDLHPVRGR